jgi:hypothetical protein
MNDVFNKPTPFSPPEEGISWNSFFESINWKNSSDENKRIDKKTSTFPSREGIKGWVNCKV